MRQSKSVYKEDILKYRQGFDIVFEAEILLRDANGIFRMIFSPSHQIQRFGVLYQLGGVVGV